MTSGVTERDRAKADRQAAFLQRGRALFAERGFSGVSLEDLGAAVGVSGPAVYRHFANKQALLGAILVRVSERLLAGGQDVVARRRLADVATGSPGRASTSTSPSRDADVIRVQDRDLASLSDEDRHTVRRLQREYVELWIGVLGRHPPDPHRVRPPRARARVLRPDQLHAAQHARRSAPRPPTARSAASWNRWRGPH